MGIGAVADIVAEHMDVTPEPDALLNEAEAPYLADKLTHGDRYGSLQTRSKYARERPVMSPEALRAVHLPHKNARNVQRRIERVLGRPLESVLREASSDIEDDRISHILDAAR